MIQDVHRIPDLIFYPYPGSLPGVKKAPDPGSGSTTLKNLMWIVDRVYHDLLFNALYIFRWMQYLLKIILLYEWLLDPNLFFNMEAISETYTSTVVHWWFLMLWKGLLVGGGWTEVNYHSTAPAEISWFRLPNPRPLQTTSVPSLRLSFCTYLSLSNSLSL